VRGQALTPLLGRLDAASPFRMNFWKERGSRVGFSCEPRTVSLLEACPSPQRVRRYTYTA